ncbi:MAG: radical SAM protein [Victivallales bacterium]
MIRNSPMLLPWRGKNIPHFALDIVRGCNIQCPGCYNQRDPFVKSLGQLSNELENALKLRRLHTLTLTGGEVTLHPELPEIIRRVREKGLHVSIITNGMEINAKLLDSLKDSPPDLILLHIQKEQKRLDMPIQTEEAARELRRSKAELIASYGIVAGLSIIINRTSLSGLPALMGEVADSPHLEYMLATCYTDFNKFRNVSGASDTGLSCSAPGNADAGSSGEEITNSEISEVLGREGYFPYAYLCSSRSRNDTSWLSYVQGIIRRGGKTGLSISVKSGFSDRLLVRLTRLITGRYMFFYRAGPLRFRIQLLLNAVSGGSFWKNIRFLLESFGAGNEMQDKHFIFQQAPSIEADGTVNYCRDCPDSTILNGRLVPSCLCDRMNDFSR